MTRQLFPHQVSAASVLTRNTSYLLAHEQGLGKTATAITACDDMAAKNILVLCLAVGKHVWENEFKAWSSTTRPLFVVHGMNATVPTSGVVICNYDLISRADSLVLAKLMKGDWDVLILDEGHSLKGKSRRRAAVYGKRCDGKFGLASKAKRTWVLTGTPAPNHAGELWPHLHALCPDLISHNGFPLPEQRFVELYCTYRDSPFGRQITGSKNMAALRERIAPFMDRKRKADVLKDLPALTFGLLPLSLHDAKVPARLIDELREAENAILETYDGNPETLIAGMKTMDTALATQRRITGLIKAELVADLVITELEADHKKKIILFAHHTAVIDTLRDALLRFNPVTLDGRSSSDNRKDAVERFQDDQTVRVFIGQIQAAGTTITLTAANDIIFAEASWVPSENLQAAARAHRIGQKRGVLARYACLEQSIDNQVMRTVQRKSEELAVLLDQQEDNAA